MKTYIVEGTAQVLVSIEVEAENEEEALENAYNMQDNLEAFYGTIGGIDQLVGTSLEECSLTPMWIVYDEVTKI